uniref:hypothetical protein n=1 Tax=Candidatus Onthocola sp. TaxID=3085646 RepID=UPI003FF022CB
MKKIVVVLIVFIANIVSVDAMKLEVRKEDEVDEFDKWLIANLANPYDEMKNNVIQKMILEYVNPNYEVRLFNNNVEVDTSKGIFVLE